MVGADAGEIQTAYHQANDKNQGGHTMKKPTNKRPGGGGKASKPATPDKMDSAAENFPQCTEATASTKEPAKPKHKNGWIHYQGRAIAKIEAESAEDYEQAKQVIEAGFRVRDEAKYWDMPPEHYWQLHNFPSDPEDWEARMQRLIEHKLGDHSSDVDGLMHSCTWTIELLWKWLHELAYKAENPNHKREAGRVLGVLYHEARLNSKADSLSEANEEFKRGIIPFPWGAKKPPAKELIHWVNRKMMKHIERWKKAVEVASTFELKKFFHRDDRDSRGVHHFVRLPMGDIKESWNSFFIQERNAHPNRSGSWGEFLDELEKHPFCTHGLNLAQLTNFNDCWQLSLYDVLQEEWSHDKEIKLACGSFVKKFGDLKHKTHMEGAGFQLARDFYERFYLPHWKQKQRLDYLWNQAVSRKRNTTKDAAAKNTLAGADLEKSSPG
jgi:hypothetical protein